MSKHILIIGGMGPQASVHAHKRLIELSQQDNTDGSNESYPRITHISVNVRDFISNSDNKKNAQEYLLRCLEDINMDHVDHGFIACNTAHLLFDKLQIAAQGKLVSVIEATGKQLAGANVGIVATPSTVQQHLYGGSVTIIPDQESLKNIETIIRKVISGVPVEELVSSLRSEIGKLRVRGADKVVLGCSELSMFSKYLDPQTIIDPIDVTIHEIVSM